MDDAAIIPIRNIWFLLVYAWGLGRYRGIIDGQLEPSPSLPHLAVDLLCQVVEKRLKRNLHRQYVPQRHVLDRVRGRIDILRTTVDGLFERGKVACRLDAQSTDTSRNRLILYALTKGATMDVDTRLKRRCSDLARHMTMAGVSLGLTKPFHTKQDTFSRNDAEDRLVIEMARLVIDLYLPSEVSGSSRLLAPQRDDVLLRTIFERAIGRFYRYHLSPTGGWKVVTGNRLFWPTVNATDGLMSLIPTMKTDIEVQKADNLLIIDTKFTNIITKNAFGKDRLKTDHIYQMYAYLHSQDSRGGRFAQVSGLLLYPSLGIEIDETAEIQGRNIRFKTIDLMQETNALEQSLLKLLNPAFEKDSDNHFFA